MSSENSQESQESEWSDFDIVDEQLNPDAAQNSSSTIEESHKYYNSTIEQNNNITSLHWQSIKGRCFNHTTNKRLSNSFLSAATVKLPFIFYFYGHPISSVLVTTDGFLYTGDRNSEHIAVSQYISPLMAHFDTSLSRDSFVKYCEDGEFNWVIQRICDLLICPSFLGNSFHVAWENVLLMNQSDVGPFSFSVSLFPNGEIVFGYERIPISIKQIKNSEFLNFKVCKKI